MIIFGCSPGQTLNAKPEVGHKVPDSVRQYNSLIFNLVPGSSDGVCHVTTSWSDIVTLHIRAGRCETRRARTDGPQNASCRRARWSSSSAAHPAAASGKLWHADQIKWSAAETSVETSLLFFFFYRWSPLAGSAGPGSVVPVFNHRLTCRSQTMRSRAALPR